MASLWYRTLFLAAASGIVLSAETNRSWDILVQSLRPGRTVVVNRMDGVKVEGELVALDNEAITVRWKAAPHVVRKADVRRVRIANIRRRNTLAGMGVGATAGAVWGGASCSGYRGACAAGGAIIGLGVGAIVGGVLPIGKALYEAPKPEKRTAAK
jgi:hypothetical protein